MNQFIKVQLTNCLQHLSTSLVTRNLNKKKLKLNLFHEETNNERNEERKTVKKHNEKRKAQVKNYKYKRKTSAITITKFNGFSLILKCEK